MRARLTLIPAAWLAITGAALPDPASLVSVYECEAGYQASLDLTAAIPPTQESGGPDSLNRYFAIPTDFTPYGLRPAIMGTNTGTMRGRPMLSLILAVAEPYAKVEAAVLAAHGLSRCPARTPDSAENCSIELPMEGGPPAMLRLKAYGGLAAITCGYIAETD